MVTREREKTSTEGQSAADDEGRGDATITAADDEARR